ncbi:MAG TPA: hypothetical protein VLS25_10230 [Dehalococcoidia bacterium]|nr:hypothetical protein [Dehalococcoidia bacterium]
MKVGVGGGRKERGVHVLDLLEVLDESAAYSKPMADGGAAADAPQG